MKNQEVAKLQKIKNSRGCQVMKHNNNYVLTKTLGINICLFAPNTESQHFWVSFIGLGPNQGHLSQ